MTDSTTSLSDPPESAAALAGEADIAGRTPAHRGGAVGDWAGRAGHVLRSDRIIQLALAGVLCIAVTAVLGPIFFGDAARDAQLLSRHVRPFSIDQGWRYVLGGDGVGRSFLARLVVASRTTLVIAVLATAIAAIVGSGVGIVVGYLGGWADALAMRVADVLLAFPILLLALVVLYSFPGGVLTISLVLAFSRVAAFTRVARGEVLAVREQVYVKAARALGASSTRIILRQVAPVIAPTIGAVSIIEFARVMLAEATLSFLGIGVQPPNVTWGILISDGQNYLADAWWVAVFPGIAITGTTVCLYLIGDWLRQAQEADE